ncbi:MAG: Do family serine endopeptidase [Acidobacteria bacterium]|nr:Do family serine endopeptidase [Acidobacteriota bacterium]MCI0719178.1 Do family serine endopeptidase [Acidobacteriota bacterium]
MRRRKLLFFSLILATLAIGVVIGTVINRSVNADKPGIAPGATAIAIPSPTQLSSEFTRIAKMVEPAVVNINTETIIKSQSRDRRQSPFGSPQEDPFDFFERFFGGPMDGPRRDMKTRALGSGFVVDKAGYIITNFHVVEKADTINVSLASGDEYKAKVIGKDQGTDIAVLKVEAKRDLPVAKLGNSDGMTQGDWVLAIGSPFGLEQTVTAGIISATGRSGSRFQRFLQTDAAINQGNSGGPLVNMAGEVIGVNTAILTSTGQNAGVGFALPSSTAANVYNQLIKTGKVTRGAIGIQMQTDATAATLRALGAPDGKGVVVSKITPDDGPAARAGLKQGDVIREINGRKLNDSLELSSVVAELTPGKSVTLKFLRDGREQTATLTIDDRAKILPKDDTDPVEESAPERGGTKLGMTVQGLTPQQARDFDMQPGEGVLVTNVQVGGVADDAGLRARDVILQINKMPVRNAEELRDIVAKLKPESEVLFLIKRLDRQTGDIGTLYLAATLP